MTLGLHAFSLFKMAFEMQKSPSNNGVIVWVWEFLWLYFFHLKKMKEIRNNFLSLSLLSQVVALEIWYFYFFLPLSFTSDFSNKLLNLILVRSVIRNIFTLRQCPFWVLRISAWIWISSKNILDYLPSKKQGMFCIIAQCFQQ